MKFKFGRVSIDLSPLFFIFCALLIFFDKTGLMSLSILSSLIHEISHIITMNLVKCPPRNIIIKPYGLEIVGGVCDSYLSSCLISLSGPVANIIFALLSGFLFGAFKEYNLLVFAVINTAIAGLNLLPVKGLDGGDVWGLIITRKFGSEKGARIFLIVSFSVALLVATLGVFFIILTDNPTLILLSIYLIALNIFKF